MRATAYGLMEIVAWPAVAWGIVELGLRLVAREAGGAMFTAQLTSCAVGTVVACRWRRRELERAIVAAR